MKSMNHFQIYKSNQNEKKNNKGIKSQRSIVNAHKAIVATLKTIQIYTKRSMFT